MADASSVGLNQLEEESLQLWSLCVREYVYVHV